MPQDYYLEEVKVTEPVEGFEDEDDEAWCDTVGMEQGTRQLLIFGLGVAVAWAWFNRKPPTAVEMRGRAIRRQLY